MLETFLKKCYRSQACNTICWSIGTIFLHIKDQFCYIIFIRKYQIRKQQFWKNRSRCWKCSIKKVFLKISQNLQTNACVGFSFSINFIKYFLRQRNLVLAYHDNIFSLDIMSYLYIKKACLHNLWMNRASLGRESLDRVSWTSTTSRTLRHHKF